MRDERSIVTWRTPSSASSGSVDILPHVDTSADKITMHAVGATTCRVCLRSRSAKQQQRNPQIGPERFSTARRALISVATEGRDSLDNPTKPKRTVTCPRAQPRCMCFCLREWLHFHDSSCCSLLHHFLASFVEVGRAFSIARCNHLWCSSRCFAEDCTPRPNNRTVRISTISWPEKLKRSMRKAARPSIHAPAH